MSELSRRSFLRRAGLATAGFTLGPLAIAQVAAGDTPPTPGDGTAGTDFMHPVKAGRVFTTLDDARRAAPEPGDIVLIRDLSQLAPPDIRTEAFARGKWHLRDYRLADGQSGRLLMVCDVAGDEGPAAVPPEFDVRLDLPGWYAIWLGVPLMQRSAHGGGGVSVAVDNDPGYTLVAPEANRFRGRWAHPCNCEYQCYWKCVRLDQRTLHIRVPWGTYSSAVWGLVRGCLSALRLVRLTESQVQAYLADVADPTTKRVMVVNDGFSPYWAYAEPGKGIDAQLAMGYRNSDVGKYLLQTPSTGVASWPGTATSLVGELVGQDQWRDLRKGDRRIYDYVQWAVRNRQESFRVAAQTLKGSSTELHASLRMNIFFGDGAIGRLLNGRFWFEHPELRKPGSGQLDYAIPAVRAYISGILMELAGSYDLSGINLDFTRWPPIADPARHDGSVLLSFIKEVRQSLDKVQAHTGRKLALSAHLADEFYTGGDLAAQKIDLDPWLASGVLDFVSVEARRQEPYLAIAKRHGVPYYAAQDWGVKGMFPDEDPELPMPTGTPDHDPYPGDEFVEQRELDEQFGKGVDPTDYDRGLAVRYAQGVDGVCLTNRQMGECTTGRLGHPGEMAERGARGAIWGQEPGPTLSVS
jgi:hypothetical protein